MNHKRLFRDSSNEIIGGIASGLARYFDVDPTIVRVLFIVGAFFGGGLILYVILWIVVPRDHSTNFSNQPEQNEQHYSQTNEPQGVRDENMQSEIERRRRGSLIGGLVLIVIGSLFILERFIPRINFRDFWPFMLVILGLIILFSGFINTNKDER
ncbi:PspC domain-containing protein [Bacteroidota bacterium]